MRGGFTSSNILGIAAACLFLSSLPVGGTQPAAYLDELVTLAELHKQGMLTDEEFAAKKAQLLDLDPKETTSVGAARVSDAGKPRAVRLLEGTEIYLVFAEALSSGSNTEGDRFHLRVDDDVKVDGTVVIPRDALAVGTVKVAKKRRRMGRKGHLSIRLDYVKAGDERVRLRANKTKEGEGKVGSTVALTVLFGPLGLLKRGKDIEIQNGSPITAFVDQDVDLIVPDKTTMKPESQAVTNFAEPNDDSLVDLELPEPNRDAAATIAASSLKTTMKPEGETLTDFAEPNDEPVVDLELLELKGSVEHGYFLGKLRNESTSATIREITVTITCKVPGEEDSRSFRLEVSSPPQSTRRLKLPIWWGRIGKEFYSIEITAAKK